MAIATGLPSYDSSHAVLAQNPQMYDVLGYQPPVFGMGEVGGSAADYNSAPLGLETSTSTLTFDGTLTTQQLGHNLDVGLYDGTLLGTQVLGGVLDVTANGVDLLHQAFSTGAAMNSYFDDHGISFGALTGAAYAGGALDLTVQLQVTTQQQQVSATSPTSGFYGGVIIAA